MRKSWSKSSLEICEKRFLPQNTEKKDNGEGKIRQNNAFVFS